jgi:hypothetical protein
VVPDNEAAPARRPAMQRRRLSFFIGRLMKVNGYLVIETDALRGKETVYPVPPSR